MAFCLLDECWVPVRRADGVLVRIPPWQITDSNNHGGVCDLASPRPDLDGALLEFLIGLVQTALTPASEDEWFERWEKPPGPEELRNALVPLRDAFFLNGDGPRFMQDPESADHEDKYRPISWLFMDAPSENTEKQNRDLFVKRRGFKQLCPGCAAAALFTLQTHASSGGQGHFASLRGRGPLSAIVLGNDLWRSVWANVLSRRQLNAHGKATSSVRFPWMPCETRKATANTVLPNTVHPVYRYWGMPRRISLIFEDSTAVCDLCGLQATPIVTQYATLPRGNKYEGPWRHPLTPYRITAQGKPLPISGTADVIRYRHWLGLTLGEAAGKFSVEPAEVVRVFAARCKDLAEGEREFRIRGYGYDMDNMKARGFCFGDMPAWSLAKPKVRQAFAFEVQRLLSAADYVAWQLRNTVFNAVVHAHRGGRNRKSLARRTIFQAFVDRFWSDTEPGFYALLPELHQAVVDQEETLPIREAWRSRLAAVALGLFDQAASTISIGTGDVKRVAKSQRALQRAVGPWSREMRKRLDLPEPVTIGKELEEGAVA